ncbi:hypothetical protein [Bdellovibrio sp. HCB2-146]|uniref:hypothetical protein n=1 Tax=Bdellovibrio sp. HCB2-146 TaxID=3394362 RepID=UPI0039BCBF47
MKKRLQDKAQEQKAVLVLSIASVLLMTVFLNQWLVNGPDRSLSGSGNRQVASFEPGVFAKDIKWEHDLAKKISNDKANLFANLAEKPTLRDELIFAYLEGKYGMKLNQGRIEKLEFIDAQAGEQPMAIDDKPAFLRQYAEAFGLNYSEASLTATTDSNQVFNLIDSDKTIVGTATFELDHQGRVQAIKINQ